MYQKFKTICYSVISDLEDPPDYPAVSVESINKIGSAALLSLRRIKEASE